jgi:glycogen operon protein
MTEENWKHDFAKSLAVYLNGRGLLTVGTQGELIIDDSFYVIFNAHHEPLDFKLPKDIYGKEWTKIIDTSTFNTPEVVYKAEDIVRADSRSVILLHHKILGNDENKDL